MELTPWKPLGETLRHPDSQRLLAALRSSLPSIEVTVQREHWLGEIKDVRHSSEPDTANAVMLNKLSWRLVEFVSCNNRDMGLWNYQGIAWLNQKRVDFSGSYLRDLTTGAFWEFELKTMGI